MAGIFRKFLIRNGNGHTSQMVPGLSFYPICRVVAQTQNSALQLNIRITKRRIDEKNVLNITKVPIAQIVSKYMYHT